MCLPVSREMWVENPYQAPRSLPPPLPAIRGADANRIQLTVGLVSALIAALIPTLVVPQFRQMLEAFGADLPLISYLTLYYYPALWALPLLVLAARSFWPQPRQRGIAACLIGLIPLVMMIPFLLVALYLPIFKLASAI